MCLYIFSPCSDTGRLTSPSLLSRAPSLFDVNAVILGEAPAGPSQAMLILQQHIHNFLLSLQLLSLIPHAVRCSRDTTMLATRGTLEILFFAVLGIYLSLPRYCSTKIANNKGTVRESRERWTCIIIQLARKNRHGTTTSKACGSCTQGRTWQAGPCSRILRQKQL